MATLYDFEARAIHGETIPLSTYRGKVLLIVNVASACGFTPQYEGLEKLYETYRERGLEVLGFPCNQFGHQEPGDEAQIQSFCTGRFGVKFPMFAKVDVNGANAHPLYRFLTDQRRGWLGSRRVKWNFTKFLVDREGHPIQRYAPTTAPAQISADIEAALERDITA